MRKGLNMTEQTGLWQLWDNLIFTRLIRSFKMAIRPTKMVIAMLAVTLICLTGWVMDVCTMTSPKKRPIFESTVSTIATFGHEASMQVYLASPVELMASIEDYHNKSDSGVFSTLCNYSAARFNSATVSLIGGDVFDVFLNFSNVLLNIWGFLIGPIWAIKYHTLYSVIFFALTIPVICIAGGAICRCAALEFGRGEKAGLGQAIRFAVRNFLNLLTGPSVCMGIMIFLASFIYVMGLIGNIPWVGELVIGIGLVAALVFGLLTVLVFIGTVAGGGLMFPVIACEGSDGYDAISRSFCYIFNQPWRMLLYSVVATIHGTIAYLFVRFFVYLVLITTHSLLNLGIINNTSGPDKLAMIWPKPEFFDLLSTSTANNAGNLNLIQGVSSFMVHLSVIFVVGLIVAFVISFYFSASTIIYSLIRTNVDGVGIDQVYAPLDSMGDSKDKAE
jgi:hypothetical protein